MMAATAQPCFGMKELDDKAQYYSVDSEYFLTRLNLEAPAIYKINPTTPIGFIFTKVQ